MNSPFSLERSSGGPVILAGDLVTAFVPWMQVRLFIDGLMWQLSSFRYFVLYLLFGQDGGEVFHLKNLANFDFGVDPGVAVGGTLDPLDGLFEGLHLQYREAGGELFGLGEGAVDNGKRFAGEFDACAFGAGM